MRSYFPIVVIFLLYLSSLSFAQQTPVKAPSEFGKPSSPAPGSDLEALFQAKVKAEWEAIKTQNKKAYGDLLADDYEGVEVDGQGERTKERAIRELSESNVSNYTLWGFRMIPLSPTSAFVIYEVSLQFPPRSAVRFSRVYVTELWVKRAGEWEELHYQETHVK